MIGAGETYVIKPPGILFEILVHPSGNIYKQGESDAGQRRTNPILR